MISNLSVSEQHKDTCFSLRQCAEKSLVQMIRWLNSSERKISEFEATNQLSELLKVNGISDFWYPSGSLSTIMPNLDQFGTIVVFDTKEHPNRSLTGNFRAFQPSNNVYWEGLGYFYVSPHKLNSTENLTYAAWGDIGLSVYLGSDAFTREKFRLRYKMQEALLSDLSIPFLTGSEFFRKYAVVSSDAGFSNIAASVSGPTQKQNDTNIGHSFPLIKANRDILPDELKRKCRESRIFLDDQNHEPLAGKLWTFESRDTCSKYRWGSISFHQLFSVLETVEFATDFRKLFSEIGMGWMN